MEESVSDRLLNISTSEDKRDSGNSLHYHPYEATPYAALEELFNAYPLTGEDRLVDFGCGKGRLSFMANYRFGVTVTGIEMNDALFGQAIQNRINYVQKFDENKEKLPFYCLLAEDYQIHRLDNKFYFFNPFSIQIFITIINNILKSVEGSGRDIELVLYYCSQEYYYYLEDYTPFELIEEIKLNEYEKNPFERFLIYRFAVD